jgi:hypothetical protein
VAWLLKDKASAPLVKSTVLLDPVTFVLFDPAIAFNFIHRTPSNVMQVVLCCDPLCWVATGRAALQPGCTVQLLIHYFVSREMFIAHTLCRHFSWSHNVIFMPDLADTPTTIILSEHDEIVPFRKTMEYLARENGRGGTAKAEILAISCQHGEMMLRAAQLRRVLQAIGLRCKGA